MKKACLFIILLLSFLLFSCDNGEKLEIEGNEKIEIGFEYEYIAKYKGNELENDAVDWIIDNPNVASIVDNKITAINGGEFTLTAVYKADGTVYGSKKIKVINAIVESIKIRNTKTSIYQYESLILSCIIGTEDGTTDQPIIWSVDRSDLASIDGAGDSAALEALKPGTVIVSVKCSSAVDTYQIEIIEVITDIEYYGYNELVVDTCTTLSFNIDDPVITVLSDNIEYKGGYLYALSAGEAAINVKSKKNSSLSKDIEFNVVDNRVGLEEATEDELEQINAYLEGMSLEEKIGQMLFVNLYLPGLSNGLGWRRTQINVDNDSEGLYYTLQQNNNVPSTYRVEEQFNGYYFGNLSLNQLTTSNAQVTNAFIKGMQNYFIDKYRIGGITEISDTYEYDSMGSLLSAYTDNISLGTLNDIETCKKYFNYLSSDLKEMGVTMYNSPAYFYQKYTEEMFSYRDDKNVLYSSLEKNILKENNVTLSPVFTMCDDTDFLDVSNRNRILKAISDNVESIAFYDYSAGECIDSKKPIKYLLDNGYKGLIINLLSIDNTSYYVDAINKGVNMFKVTLYLENQYDRNNNYYQELNETLFNTIDGIINAVNDGDISIDLINNSVKKVLLYKLRNGIINGVYPEDEFQTNEAANEYISAFSNYGNLISINHEFTGIDKTHTVYSYAKKGDTCELIANVKKTGYNKFVNNAITPENISFNNSYSEGEELKGFDRITNDDTVILFIDEEYVDYAIDMGEYDEYVTVYWTDLISLIEQKTSNIILVFINDPLVGKNFSDSYPQIYLNYNYKKGYNLVFNVIESGKANGTNIYSK